MSDRYLISLPAIVFFGWILIIAYSMLALSGIFPLLRIFFVLPAVYITPGMFLYILHVSRTNEEYKIIPIIIKSFFISQALVILIMYILLVFKIPLNTFTFNFSLISYSLFIGILLLVRMKRVHKLSFGFYDNFFNLFLVIFIFISYLLITKFYFPYKTLDRDETEYICWARYIPLNSEIFTVFQDPLASWIEDLFRGRIFWISLIATYVLSTGLQWGHAWIMGSMFIPMTALVAVLLIPSSVKYEKALKVSTLMLVLSNPLVLTFGRSVQPDLAQAFYATLAIYYIIESFKLKGNKATENSGLSLNIRCILLAMIILAVSFTIRENAGVFFEISFFIVIMSIISGLWKIKRIFAPLFIFSIFLIILFILIRPLGLMIPDIGSYSFLDYVKRFYTILSPESLNPLTSLSVILLPVVLWWALRKNDYEISTLSLIAIIMVIVTFISSFTSFDFFFNISRYGLYMLPTLTVVSLSMIFSYNYSRYTYIFIIPVMCLFLCANYKLTLSGSSVFLNIPYEQGLHDTFTVTLALFLSIYLAMAISNTYMGFKFRFEILKKNVKFNLLSLAFVVIVLSALVSNIYFSQILAFSYSKYAQNYDLTNAGYWDNMGEQSVIVSNFYYYLRCYVPDKVFSKSILLSVPIEEEEYLKLINTLPKNAFLVLTDDPRLAWYHYGNKKYINKYIFEWPDISITREGYGNIVFLGSTSLPKGKVMLYKATSSVVWKEGQSSLRINEVAVIPAYNNKDVQLHIKLWSDRNQKITIIVNTYQFSKILEAHLIPGLNDLKFNFSYLLPDGKSYGSQIQGWSDVIIIDADGNIAFHDVLAAFVMRRNTLPIYTWILFLALIIALFMFLDR